MANEVSPINGSSTENNSTDHFVESTNAIRRRYADGLRAQSERLHSQMPEAREIDEILGRLKRK